MATGRELIPAKRCRFCGSPAWPGFELCKRHLQATAMEVLDEHPGGMRRFTPYDPAGVLLAAVEKREYVSAATEERQRFILTPEEAAAYPLTSPLFRKLEDKPKVWDLAWHGGSISELADAFYRYLRERAWVSEEGMNGYKA